MGIHNYDSGDKPKGETWDTDALRRDFDIVGFAAPLVVVRRKSDGQEGTLEFTHNPRVYWGFQPSA
jgi:hypothetical protein